jgi:hypothetical protein
VDWKNPTSANVEEHSLLGGDKSARRHAGEGLEIGDAVRLVVVPRLQGDLDKSRPFGPS